MSKELADTILAEAKRLHHEQQGKLLIGSMCIIKLEEAHDGDDDATVLGSVYVSQRAAGKCVVMFEHAPHVVVDCTEQTLTAIVADWKDLKLASDFRTSLVLYKLSGYNSHKHSFKHESKLLEVHVKVLEERKQYILEMDSLKGGLMHCLQVVAAVQTAVQSPFSRIK